MRAIPLPEELGQVSAGSLLCELLDDVPMDAVSGFDTVTVLVAAYRQHTRQQAVFLRALYETGIRKPFSGTRVERVDVLGEFSCEEARAALVWSRQRATAQMTLAADVFDRLPILGEKMLAGQLDLPRARAFITWTEGLTDEQANQICHDLAGQAPSMVVGDLIEAIKRAAIAIDPGWAQKQYSEAVKARRVRGFTNPDGTGTIGGYAQPVDRVIAACERIDAMARACKHAGDRRKIDLVRSDLFVRMLDGTFDGFTEQQMIDYVVANPLADPVTTPEGDGGDLDKPGGGDGTANNGRDGAGACPDGNDDNGGGGPEGPTEPPTPGAEDQPAAEPAAPEPAEDGAGDVDPTAGQAESAAGTGEPTASGSRGGRAVSELRVQLRMLLGQNEEPAQVAGWGYAPAWLARHLVARMHSAQWRWVVCNDAGYPVDGGITSIRPATTATASGRVGTGGRARRDPAGGGIVEIAVIESDLDLLSATPADPGVVPWAAVITDIAAQHAATEPGTPDTDTADAHKRVPRAKLRLWVQLRDRQCAHPGCRAPAVGADVDHRIDYAAGGATVGINLEPFCRHDHRVKGEAGWAIHLTESGMIVWTSPLGHSYEWRAPPAIPKPITTCARDQEPIQVDPPAWLEYGGYRQSICDCLARPCPHTRHPNDENASERVAGGGLEQLPEGLRISVKNYRERLHAMDRADAIDAAAANSGDEPAIYDDGETAPF